MCKVKIQLVTLNDCARFVAAVNKVGDKVYLESNNGEFRINAKSLLGAMASVEWGDLWVVSDSDIYYEVSAWATNS